MAPSDPRATPRSLNLRSMRVVAIALVAVLVAAAAVRSVEPGSEVDTQKCRLIGRDTSARRRFHGGDRNMGDVMGRELLQFQRVLARDPRVALKAVRAAVMRGQNAPEPARAVTVTACMLADELVWQLGGFASVECGRTEHGDRLEAYGFALVRLGARSAARACMAAAELVRTDRDTDEALRRLEDEFRSQDPPLVGLLADFLSEVSDPWFEDRVNTDELTSTLAKVDDIQVLWNAVEIGHIPLVEACAGRM